MKYTDYNVDDFLKDEYFKHWVLHPDQNAEYFWSAFLQNHPGKQQAIGMARSILLSISYPGPQVAPLSDEENKALFQKILEGKVVAPARPNRHLWLRMNSGLKAAIIILLCLASAVVWFEVDQQHIAITADPAPRTVVKSTEYGQKLLVHLEDGSVVNLNSGSSISYPENFKEHREVILKGEAFFDVAKLSGEPFTVKTGEVTTTVLGTAFNVKYDNKAKVEVAVLRGKVAVNTNNSRNNQQDFILLNPSEMVKYDPRLDGLKKGTFEYNQVFAWTKGIIFFKNNNIDDILSTLERWYGVHFNVTKSLSKKKDFSGMYEGKDLETVLIGLSFAYGFKYEIKGKEVTIE